MLFLKCPLGWGLGLHAKNLFTVSFAVSWRFSCAFARRCSYTVWPLCFASEKPNAVPEAAARQLFHPLFSVSHLTSGRALEKPPEVCHLLVEIQYYNLLALPLWMPCLSELKNMATRGRCFSASPNICSRIIMMTRGCSTVPSTVFIHSVRGSGLDWFTPSLHRMQL